MHSQIITWDKIKPFCENGTERPKSKELCTIKQEYKQKKKSNIILIKILKAEIN